MRQSKNIPICSRKSSKCAENRCLWAKNLVYNEIKFIFATTNVTNKLNYLIVMKELLENINAQIALFQANAAAQVEKNNKAAGTRARKAALELSKLLKDFRKISVEEAKK